MKNDFLAMTNYFPQLKSLFLSFSQANRNFFSLEKKFCLDKVYYVRADGPGISVNPKKICLFSTSKVKEKSVTKYRVL